MVVGQKRKQQLLDSRLLTTSLLVEHFKQKPPKLFINASAIGFYGETGQTLVNENSDAGKDFVSDLAKQWEASCDAIQSPQTRLVKIRTGIVMSKQGGALAKMLPAFKAGAGGKIGSGKQYMSWIDIEDVCHAIQFIIEHSNITGPVNLVSPTAETNKAFSIALSKQLNRPCIFPLPGIIVKLLFGEMGEALLLSSTRVKPSKLLEAGFQFKYPNLPGCLKERLK
ncbi:TIGR01777 family oxidoreductase [Psychromonas sp. KJ10-10]|uniref:TIGR01777 family oxidoreductase n=1 Tax=Psychromonas sp. KJ10-10 TaxID=3391823 RepID=UPI0039B497D1